MAQECEKITFLDHLDNEHIAFSFGPQAQTPLIRFHSTSSDIALLTDSSEWQALQKSIELLSQQGGYLVCLDSTKAMGAKIASGSAAKNCGDMKDFGIGAQILKQLGVKDFTLLSSLTCICKKALRCSKVDSRSWVCGGCRSFGLALCLRSLGGSGCLGVGL